LLAESDIICDGVDDSLTTGSAASNFLTASAYTIMIVVKHNDATPDTGGVCGRDALTGDDNDIVVIKARSTPNFAAQNWDGTADCAVGTFSTNWVHLTSRLSGGNIELFVDGVLAQTTVSGNASTLANLIQVCGTGDNATDFAPITVAQVEYYNTAKDDNYIAAVAKSRVKDLRKGSPTATWTLDQVAHGAAAHAVGFLDRSGNGRTLTASDGADNLGMTGTANSYMSYFGGFP
jgi:hypothetical protein